MYRCCGLNEMPLNLNIQSAVGGAIHIGLRGVALVSLEADFES